jgi:hypothetical protein
MNAMMAVFSFETKMAEMTDNALSYLVSVGPMKSPDSSDHYTVIMIYIYIYSARTIVMVNQKMRRSFAFREGR